MTDGNRHRHFHLLRETARRHDVLLVCPADDAEREALNAVADLGVEVRPVSVLAPARGRMAAALRRQPACLVPPEIDALTATAANAGRFDVAFGALSVAPAVAAAHSRRWVLDDQNVEADLYDRLWQAEPWGTRKAARFLDWRAVRRYERRWLRSAHAVTVCSSRDASRILEFATERRPRAVPNGVDLDAIQFCPDDRAQDTILFVGGMSWAPNVEAAVTLVRAVMPAVWQQRPNVRVLLVGKDPVRAVQELSGPRVTVTGAVESVTPYLRRASLTVVPLRSGGGTRLKILEAMAAGVPVVSTPVGAEGLELVHGSELLIAGSAGEMATAVLRLLSDRELGRGLAVSARKRVERDFAWPAIGRELDRLLTTCLASASETGSP